MTDAATVPAHGTPELACAIGEACRTIAPSWPLDRLIAVSPYWGLIDRPFAAALSDLGRLAGARATLPAKAYRTAWEAGEIDPAALRNALDEFDLAVTAEEALLRLTEVDAPQGAHPLPSDVLDTRGRPGTKPRWAEAITQQISQFCASFYDQHQADWHRDRGTGLYATWRAALQRDRSVSLLMGAPLLRSCSRLLPATAEGAIGWAVREFAVSGERTADFLRTCLLRINGWASWCAFRAWDARLAGRATTELEELLAIRCAWEALLVDASGASVDLPVAWRAAAAAADDANRRPQIPWGLVWQRAHELAYQRRLVDALTAAHPLRSRAPGVTPAAHLVFCIDVRSERLRRALEQIEPAYATHGFAGFFGLPLRYQPLGTVGQFAQAPGLIAASVEAGESTGDAREDEALATQRRSFLAARRSGQTLQRQPSGAFALVESAGVGYAVALLQRHLGRSADAGGHDGMPASRHARPSLRLGNASDPDRDAALVANALRGMGITDHYAPLLVFIAHGSSSANNPQAAALDCGACGGHSGEVNARLLARLVNDADVRTRLEGHGLRIPATTIALAALHNTTTDEVTILDEDLIPASHHAALRELRTRLDLAGQRTRAERAPDLGFPSAPPQAQRLLAALQRRARDWAETRPEWGLAGNAAFIAAPRIRTQAVHLAGRAFLHDYEPEADPDGSILTAILTAPVVVAHWINLQYYASAVEPDRFGSGNKVLHNVVGGSIGVFEGNTGDLRIGLARQSVWDGERLMHAPLRLSVIVDAPAERIDAVLAAQATVRQLVENEWIHLFRFAATGIEQRRGRSWHPV